MDSVKSCRIKRDESLFKNSNFPIQDMSILECSILLTEMRQRMITMLILVIESPRQYIYRFTEEMIILPIFLNSKTRQQSICINVFLLPYFKKEFPNHLYNNFWFSNCLTKWSILSEMLPSGMLIKHVTNFTYVTGMYTVRGSPLLHDKWWFIIKTRGFYLSGFTTKDGLLIQKILLLKTRSYVLFNDNWWIGYKNVLRHRGMELAHLIIICF